MVPCDPLPEIHSPANMGDLANYALELMDLYEVCAITHDGLIGAVK